MIRRAAALALFGAFAVQPPPAADPCNKNIFMPLGMTRSFFDRAPYHLVEHRSHSYTATDEGIAEQRFDFDSGILDRAPRQRRADRAQRRSERLHLAPLLPPAVEVRLHRLVQHRRHVENAIRGTRRGRWTTNLRDVIVQELFK